jgi:hypothetical protein
LKPEHGGHAIVKFNNSHLPPGCQDANRWRCVYVPTYITFVAAYQNPWTVADHDAIRAMQTIWDHLYKNPKIAHKIQAQQAVFCVVSVHMAVDWLLDC